MASILETIATELIDQIKQDTLVLPSLPEVCLRVRDVAEDIESSIPQLAQIISQDAALAARVIKVANSPLVRTPSEVTDLVTAVNRLGINFTSNLAMGLAMEQLFQATSDVVDRRMRSIWQQSSEVASICHVLASHYTKLHPDQAMLAGLIHKIGALPILTYAEDNNALLNDGFALDKLIEKLHPLIGSHILKAWRFPKELLNVPGQYLKFDREISKVDYADLVTVAVLQTHANSEHPYAKLDWSTIQAFDRVGLSPDMDMAEAIDIDDDISGLLS
ncbi:HDOD domain-containing protein [Bermanella sp. WJH001]|uniref:HDOD domain-containing protein n=1 Tax=Bermanella sp. WJH001 TaxID=3048005 RepID=UPI0024BEB5FB|nr:HDOD domain-containing protein [Bermanella sp. WJH001]MDJ1539785.1 HDOD domain-containing protein [Bermanella sp. WJH001]